MIRTLYATYASQPYMKTAMTALICAVCGLFSDPLLIFESQFVFNGMLPAYALVGGNPTENERQGELPSLQL